MLFKNTSTTHVVKNILLSKKEPVSVVHFVTNRCNARCSFCFIDFEDPKTFAGELSIEEIDKLTKNLGKSLLNVNMTGGEPFARKDLIDSINRDAYGGVDIFEGVEPMSSGGKPSGDSQPGSPLGDVAPNDPGVNIDGILNIAGDSWGKFI